MKNAILKKKRMNAMKVISLLILGLLFQYQQNIINAQAPLCINAQPICSDATNSSFPNSINNDIPVGPDYGCLQRISGVNDVNAMVAPRSEEHTSELQSRPDLVCRLLLEKKK